MADTARAQAHRSLVALTMQGACLAQEVSSRAELEARHGYQLEQAMTIGRELQSALAHHDARVATSCAEDARELLRGRALDSTARDLLEAWLLVDQLLIDFLLARQKTHLPGPLLAQMYGLTLKAPV